MKFFVKDEEGQKFEVEEVEEKTEPTTDEDPASLTEEEIMALKNLAARANDIINLLAVEEEEHEVVSDEDEEMMDEEEKEKEVVVDTDEEAEEIIKKANDSKKSVGSIMKKTVANDSIDNSEDINTAWAKRYGGKF